MPRAELLREQAVNRWLKLLFREHHDSVAAEPLPDALLKLLRDDRQV